MLGKILVGRAVIKSGVRAGMKKARRDAEWEDSMRLSEEDLERYRIARAERKAERQVKKAERQLNNTEKRFKINTTTTSLILSIISIIMLIIEHYEKTSYGIIFSITALILLIPKIINIIKNKKISEISGKIIISCVLIIFSIITYSIKDINQNIIDNAYSSLEKVDVNGLIVSEACKIVREKGWRIYKIGSNSNCSDNKSIVTSVTYHDKKYNWQGEINDVYETVYFGIQ